MLEARSEREKLLEKTVLIFTTAAFSKGKAKLKPGRCEDRTGILRLFQNLWPETVFTEVDPCLQRVQGL